MVLPVCEDRKYFEMVSTSYSSCLPEQVVLAVVAAPLLLRCSLEQVERGSHIVEEEEGIAV